jgi:hypothetical protein
MPKKQRIVPTNLSLPDLIVLQDCLGYFPRQHSGIANIAGSFISGEGGNYEIFFVIVLNMSYEPPKLALEIIDDEPSIGLSEMGLLDFEFGRP